jgi:hypothetical protein
MIDTMRYALIDVATDIDSCRRSREGYYKIWYSWKGLSEVSRDGDVYPVYGGVEVELPRVG